MLTFEAVTTYGPQHWESHARRCVETFGQYWDGMTLRRFTDDQLLELSPWLAEFKERHRGRPTHNYRFDAVRFAHKVAALELAYILGRADVLIWMDADCLTHAPVDAAWLTGLLDDGELAFLPRAKKYPETGFMMLRRSSACGELIRQVVELYRTDDLFDLEEWHDCWAIQHVLKTLYIRRTNLSGWAGFHSSHPLVNGPLGERLDHLKGKRKATGRSHRTDLIATRTEPYWSGNGTTL